MRSRSLISRLMVLMVALTLPLSALAGDEVGKIRGNSSSIEWDLSRSGHESITLYVQDPTGQLYSKKFNGNATPTFRMSDTKGCPPDGVYTYELRVTPQISGAVKAALAAARASGDDARAAEILKANGLTSQVVQSGAFGAANCAFLDPSAVEPDANDSQAAGASSRGNVTSSAARPGNVGVDDQVIPDDLIVQGSACVGLDCVNGESFGFDTIRMKENNTQINYTDTSTSAGFPTNDWTIVANDSNSGGLSYLAFNDVTNARKTFVVEAAAPANALYVDSTGNVGLQQSNPTLDFHVTTTDTPAIRLEQSNAGGFTAQTWDIGANEANFFVRDVTGGSKLSLRIRPGAPTSSLDIAASGNVGIGTGSPVAKLHVEGDSYVNGNLGVGTSAPGVRLDVNGGIRTNSGFDFNDGIRRMIFGGDVTGGYIATLTSHSLRFQTVGTDRLYIDTAGNTGIGTTSPSSKLHVNGGDIRVSGGSFIDDGTTLNVPDYVFEDSYKLLSMDELTSFIKTNKHLPNVPSAKDIAAKGVNMSKFQMSLLEKVEELTLYTVAQHEQLGSLKAQNEKLMERLAALEAAIGNR